MIEAALRMAAHAARAQAALPLSPLERLARENERLRDRVEELEEALGMTIPVPAGFRAENLTRRAWKTLCLLAKRGEFTREQALIAIYPGLDERPSCQMVSVIIAALRRALEPHGIVITTRWGYGYSLSPQMREKARALIERLASGEAA